jgi:hypothetical protein
MDPPNPGLAKGTVGEKPLGETVNITIKNEENLKIRGRREMVAARRTTHERKYALNPVPINSEYY